MADEGINSIMRDLQIHIRNANIQLNNISTIAQNGDEKVRIVLVSSLIKITPGRSVNMQLQVEVTVHQFYEVTYKQLSCQNAKL